MFQMSLPVHTCEGPINFKAAEIRCTIEIRCTFGGLSLGPLMMRTTDEQLSRPVTRVTASQWKVARCYITPGYAI